MWSSDSLTDLCAKGEHAVPELGERKLDNWLVATAHSQLDVPTETAQLILDFARS